MKIAVIIVTYQTRKEELETLQQQWNAVSPVTFFITDNSNTQKGFAYGVNRGMRKAYEQGYELFIVCNTDISIQGLTVKQLENASKEFAIFGFAMDQNGKTYYGGEIDTLRYSGGLIDKKTDSCYSPVDFVTGSFMGISRTVIDTIGYFDEGYGMYYEDVDYCYRAKKAGLLVGINTEFIYRHFETSRTNKQKARYLALNRFRFFLRYAPIRAKIYECIRAQLTLWEYCRLFFGKEKSNQW